MSKKRPSSADVKQAEAHYVSMLLQYGPNNQATIRAEIIYRELKWKREGKSK